MSEDLEKQPMHQAPVVTIGNPGPLGLCGFALTTFVLSLFNIGAGVPSGGPTQVVMGLALFYGGLVQLLAGMWEFRCGNTFGATAFSSYGGFWLSFASIFIPGLGVLDAYATLPTDELLNALGIYLFGWFIFTFILFLATLKTSVGLTSLFGFLSITFLLLATAKFAHLSPGNNVDKAGGVFGLITAFIAWYNAMSTLIHKENSYVAFPVGKFN